MRKGIKIITLLALILTFIVIDKSKNVNAATVNYHDYSDINKLPTKYSYGTLFYTENTNVEVLSAHWETTDKTRWGADVGEEIKLKITNCAVDMDGELCDVIVTIGNIQSFKNYNASEGNSMFPNVKFNTNERMVATIAIIPNFVGKDNKTIIHCDSVGDVILFNLNLFYGTAEFTIDYYKAGTNIQANINGTIAEIFDIDIYTNSTLYSNEYFKGREGLTPLYDSNIYYKKNSSLSQENGGIFIGKNVENLNYFVTSTSCFVTQSQKSTYSMKYGGSNCGILYCFASPYAFEIDSPKKSVNKNIVYEEEEFTYIISQYIPNNYYSGVIGFLEGNSGLYSSFKIEDTINNNLTILSGTKVINENGTDVTSYFNISISGNKVVATLKSEYLSKREFYMHSYKVQIPVKFNRGSGKNVGSVSNIASTTVATGGNETVKNTEEVLVGLKYNITTRASIVPGVILVGDKKIISTEDEYIETVNHSSNSEILVRFKTDKFYDIDSVIINGSNIDKDTLTIDSEGYYKYTFVNNNVRESINQSIEVTTALIKGSINVTKIDKIDSTKYLSGATYKIEKLDENGNIDESFTVVEKITGDDGKIQFNDLLVGKYRVTEIKAPDGYELNNTPIEVEITSSNRQINITLNDRLKLELPETGGKRIKIFYIIGIVLILTSIVINKSKVIKNI